MKGKNFEIVAAAQDTGGVQAAGGFYDRAGATFTALIDESHAVSSLYNMINVPTGVWIDEGGRIVRPGEVAYTSDKSLSVGGKTLTAPGDAYVAALRDWVEKGARSAYVMPPEEISRRLRPRSAAEAEADASFKLAVYLHQSGRAELARVYWKAAQDLRGNSWNYHRQEWSFTPQEAGANWLAKFLSLGDEPYYAPPDLPMETGKPEP